MSARRASTPVRWPLAALLLAAAPLAAAQAPLQVWVSILPQAYLVERVGGDLVAVNVLVTPGASHETYEPTPRQMAELGQARVLIRVGLPFEESLLRKVTANLPGLLVVDGREGIELEPMEGPLADDGEETGHDHRAGSPDPHFWLDPQRLVTHAGTISRMLASLDPAHADTFERNRAALARDLEALDSRLTATLAPCRGRAMLVFHPAFGYLARRYDLRQLAVEVSGKEPSANQMARLIEVAKENGARSLYVQPQFGSRAAKVVAEAIGAKVVPLDPLARDVIANLSKMAETIAAGCR